METATKKRVGRPSRETEVKIWNWMERNRETLAGLTPREIAYACKADTGLEMHPATARNLGKQVGIAVKLRGRKPAEKNTVNTDMMQALSSIVLRIAKDLGVPVSEAEAAILQP